MNTFTSDSGVKPDKLTLAIEVDKIFTKCSSILDSLEFEVNNNPHCFTKKDTFLYELIDNLRDDLIEQYDSWDYNSDENKVINIGLEICAIFARFKGKYKKKRSHFPFPDALEGRHHVSR